MSRQDPRPLEAVRHDDEVLAELSNANLLITSFARGRVELLARRIHASGSRAPFPFVRTSAADLSNAPPTLRRRCSDLLDAAAGGSMLICDVKDMRPVVQEQLVDLLTELTSTRAASAGVRLMAGTTVSLLDRVAAGKFSERLFYRLNVLHLRGGHRRSPRIKQA